MPSGTGDFVKLDLFGRRSIKIEINSVTGHLDIRESEAVVASVIEERLRKAAGLTQLQIGRILDIILSLKISVSIVQHQFLIVRTDLVHLAVRLGCLGRKDRIPRLQSIPQSASSAWRSRSPWSDANSHCTQIQADPGRTIDSELGTLSPHLDYPLWITLRYRTADARDQPKHTTKIYSISGLARSSSISDCNRIDQNETVCTGRGRMGNR